MSDKLKKPKILIIGHGRHGKDTVAELLRDNHGYTFTSSSVFVGEECVWPVMQDFYNSFEDMYNDRHNHRQLWFLLIKAYNTPDSTRTATEMQERGLDMYIGMRNNIEYQACIKSDVFDYVVWVDRSAHLQKEPRESFDIEQEVGMLCVDNNGTLEQLHQEVDDLAKFLEEDFNG